MICVHAGPKRACCLIHWGKRLPAEPDFSDAIAPLRTAGRRIVQTTHFKADGDEGLVRELFRQIVIRAVMLDATDIVTIVKPSHARGYRSFGFAEMPTFNRTWSEAYDETGAALPVRLIRLDLMAVPQERLDRFLAASSG